MKNIKYLIYLLKHKFLVFVFCCRLGIPLSGITHDLSRFSKSEWNSYADYLFGDSNNVKKDVIHHLTHNPHHWQYWETDVVLDNGKRYCHHMDDKYILEMIADWWALMGKGMFEWYEGCDINLNYNTRNEVDSIMGELKSVFNI